MNQRLLTAVVLAATLTVAACGGGEDGSRSVETASRSASADRSPTAEVAGAAAAFLEVLSDDQRELALYDFDDEAKRTGWSDRRTNRVERNGVGLGELDDEQQEAALSVMRAALSDQGYRRLEGIRAADANLASTPAPGNKGKGSSSRSFIFGEGRYFIAFFGEPSETNPFTVQFGGHHLAYNLTYEGDEVSMSPTLLAVEPVRVDTGARVLYPLRDARDAAFGALSALSGEQLLEAEINKGIVDLVLGPSNDGPFPEPKGILVDDLDRSQKAAVQKMLEAWVGDLDEDAARVLMDRYVSEFDETYLGWTGSTDPEGEEGYVRLDGPSVWIEFSNQPGVEAEGVHHHTIFRDENADYGGAAQR